MDDQNQQLSGFNPANEALSGTPNSSVVMAANQKGDSLWVRLVKRADIILAILLVLAGVGLFLIVSQNNDEQPTGTSGRFNTVNVPLEDLSSGQAVDFGDYKVLINGSLQANGDFILSPSEQPANATPGQIYYDQISNVLSYYNGTEFVAVDGGGVATLQGRAGDITLTGADGITVTDDGAGNITLTGSGAGSAAGVSSLNGLSGGLAVSNSSAAGSTITINDATGSSKGIASFNFTNLTVSGGSVNTIQNIGTGATPTFAGVNTSTVQGGSALSLLSGGNVTVGASNPTGTLFVVDTKTSAGDPTGVDGGIYYNSSSGNFRCYQGGSWTNCITASGGFVSLQNAYDNSTPAIIDLNATNDGILVRDTVGGIGGDLFAVQNSDGSVSYLAQTTSALTLGTNVDLLLQGATAYISNPQGGTGSEAFGSGANVSGNTNALAVGNGATTAGGNTVVVGTGASSQGDAVVIGVNAISNDGFADAVAIGNGADVDQLGVAVGSSAQADFASVALGSNSIAAGAWSIAIGEDAQTAGNAQIALGQGARTTADSQIVIGSSSVPILDMYLGSGIQSVSPAAASINATDGQGTDNAGGALNINAGQGTGTGNGGAINLQVAAAGTTGTSLNSLSSVATFESTGISVGNISLNTPITLQSGTGTITIGSTAADRTINIGNVDSAQTINIGQWDTTSTQMLRVGALGTSSRTILYGGHGSLGNGGIQFDSPNVLVRSAAWADTALTFGVQDSAGNNLFNVDALNDLTSVDTTGLYFMNIPVDASGYRVLCMDATNKDVRYSSSDSSCASSSARFKENIQDLEDSMGLEVISALRPVTFNYKEGDGNTRVGLIAEEVAEVLPEVVTYDENGLPLGVNYEYMVANLIKSIQQQQLQIDDLRKGVLSGGLVEITGHVRVGGDTAGTVTVPAGQTMAEVTFDHPYETVPIITTGTYDFVMVRLSNTTVSGFTVAIPEPDSRDTRINWTALEPQHSKPD